MARAGDGRARDRLFQRYLAPLQRWARGRVPSSLRDECDTDDVVQESLLRAFRNLDGFEHRHAGAMGAYLREIVQNRIRDLLRSRRRRPSFVAGEDEVRDPRADPLRAAIGVESMERYEKGLQRLEPEERALVIARVELAFSYEQIAMEFGRPSADAARMAVARVIARLAETMKTHG